MKKLINVLSLHKIFTTISKLYDFSEVGLYFFNFSYKRWTSPMSILLISEKSNVCSFNKFKQNPTSEKSHKNYVKFIFIVLLLTSFSTFANKKPLEDSLIANIGKKAKVVFYAEKKSDLDEIAKYDLNKLFAEVRKRSEKNFSNIEEVTLREVDENLKNREVNTRVSSKKWFLNLFIGRSILGPDENYFLGNRELITFPNSNTAIKQSGIYAQADGGFFLGLGGFYDKKIINNKRLKSNIRYGYGVDMMFPRVRLNAIFSSYSNDTDPLTQIFRDSIKISQSLRGSFINNTIKYLPNTTIYFQFMPNFNLIDRKGQKSWNFGAGLKLGLNINSFSKIFLRKEYITHPSIWKYLGRKSLFPSYSSLTSDLPYVSYKNKILQTTITFNAGFKYVNLFYHLNIGNLVFNGYSILESESVGKGVIRNLGTPQTFTNNTHSFGLRFGK